jgi:hypothetical protein
MRVKVLMSTLTLVGAVAAPIALAAPASAAEAALCEVSVIIHQQPGVIVESGKVGVETGEYEPYTNCI